MNSRQIRHQLEAQARRVEQLEEAAGVAVQPYSVIYLPCKDGGEGRGPGIYYPDGGRRLFVFYREREHADHVHDWLRQLPAAELEKLLASGSGSRPSPLSPAFLSAATG